MIDNTIDFADMLTLLATPAAFPGTSLQANEIDVTQTHASAVILTPDRAYKIKKPKDFGFFNYATPELRRHFCTQEVLLNTSLAPGIYLGVAPVLHYGGERWEFGAPLPADAVPPPASMHQGGRVCDYAVVMVRLPDDATLAAKVAAGTATVPLLTDVAAAVVAFHSTTPTSGTIADFGSLATIRQNWEENFSQMQPYIGRTLDEETYQQIVTAGRAFLEQRAPLFELRRREGHIRDCHGDLRLQHVYLLNENNPSTPPKMAILDRIEFNERFRYGDVAAEVAFLSMELDLAGRADLARAFIQAYIAQSGDTSLGEVLLFYACYRACVRAKVTSFQLDQEEITDTQRQQAQHLATDLFHLTAHYARGLTRPVVILLGGLMGTGKSTLARAVQQELGWKLLSSDIVRKQLVHLEASQPQADAFDQGIYTPEWTARTYQALQEQTTQLLGDSHSIIVDASFIRREDRQSIAQAALAQGAQVWYLECTCPRAVALQRLDQRWQQRTSGELAAGKAPSLASDGRPELYDAQQAKQEAFVATEEKGIAYSEITTAGPLAHSVEQTLEALAIPRLICPLFQ